MQSHARTARAAGKPLVVPVFSRGKRPKSGVKPSFLGPRQGIAKALLVPSAVEDYTSKSGPGDRPGQEYADA
jgi:hypothetical protein